MVLWAHESSLVASVAGVAAGDDAAEAGGAASRARSAAGPGGNRSEGSCWG